MRLLFAAVGGLLLLPAPAAAAPDYAREIAPILRIYCAGCHNDREAEAGFSVERFAALVAGGDTGGEAIVPGDAAASLVVRRIRSTADDHMPPLDEPQVPAADLATLEAWIAAGAPGPADDASILETLVVPPLPAARGPRPVTAVAASPDGGSVAIARGRSLVVAGISAGRIGPEPLTMFADFAGTIAATHFSSDGRRLVMAGGTAGLRGVAQLRDAATGAVQATFGGHRDLVCDAELSPDGTMLATAGYDRSIKLWRTDDGTLLRSLDVHTGAVFDVAWHPAGQVLASASADETVKLWRASDGLRLDTLSQPQAEVASVAFTPDGRHLIAAGRDRRIYLWQMSSPDQPTTAVLHRTSFAHESPIVALEPLADGQRLVTAAEDRTAKVWSLPDLSHLADLPRQPDIAATLAAAGDGLVIGRMDGSVEWASARAVPAASPPPAAVAAQPVASSSPEGKPAAAAEAEPNDAADRAMAVALPAAVTCAISRPGDVDCVRFAAQAGAAVAVEVVGARAKPASKIDSRLEILHADGRPVEQVVLQAVRDSWFTFRGKDSVQAADFRLHDQEAMELDQYVYAGGEVVRLWLYPRGPDSGFDVYPGAGSRHGFFHTTPVVHSLGEPAWVVEPLRPGAAPVPNGLPVFRLFYENDDESTRRLGVDSLVLFVPPADGEYVARVTDVRGFGGPTDYHYTLVIRRPNPSFVVATGGKDPKVSPGSGRELTFTATRVEGFDGPIRIEVDNLPDGFTFHGPIEIEAGQHVARGVLSAAADAVAPDDAADKAVKVRAIATIAGVETVRDMGSLGDLQLADRAKVTVEILPGSDPAATRQVPGEPLEFTIRPGQTITARARIARHDMTDAVSLGNETAGRNLPHGVFIDNIGLNGLLIVEGQDEREFAITAAPKTAPGRRLFHLRTNPDGGQTSPPAVINVLPAGGR